ncbi:MAG: S8 family peptidase [Spirochaetota bacterium]
MRMTRRALRIHLLSIITVLLLAGCPNFTQDTDPALGTYDPIRPDDTRYDEQWSLNLDNFIHMEEAWGVLHSDDVQNMLAERDLPREVVVAVLDTEIDTEHPDLDGVLVDGYDAIDKQEIDVSNSTAESQEFFDDQDHGSHVAGIIGAAADNDETGIAGVGWLPPGTQVRIMPVTVLDSQGVGSPENIIEGLMYAAGMHQDEQPQRPADVINLSLGADPKDVPSAIREPWREALEEIGKAEISVIAAAGNSINSSCAPVLFPASHSSTIAVGSADPPDNTRSLYSNCGDQLDIMAPGGTDKNGDDFSEVLSLSHTEDSTSENYTTLAGTSMAAPHVAGVAALLYAISNDMSPDAVRRILTETASPIEHAGALPNEEYGWGLLHAERAVRRALMKPYGPYRNDGSATMHEQWPFSPQGNVETESTHSTSPPPEGTYAADRAALVLERDWYENTPSAERRARLNEIADAHDLLEIRDRGHRFPTAYLPEGEEVSLELLEDLRAETEIRFADFSVYFYRQ